MWWILTGGINDFGLRILDIGFSKHYTLNTKHKIRKKLIFINYH
jgi:hypothetical protein